MITLNSNIELTEIDKIFIDLIDNRITGYKQIPYTVPPKLIIDMIKDSARLFYKAYWRASKKSFYRLDIGAILDFFTETTENQNLSLRDIGRVVTLPTYIRNVKGVFETNKSTVSNDDDDYSIDRRLDGINKHLYVLEQACKLVEETMYNSTMGTTIPFNYNPLINQLEMYSDINQSLILECIVDIPIQYLYNDDLFIRHVIGTSKRELKRVIGGHTIPLPGGATLNADEICNNLDDIEKVEETIKQSSGIGDIILTSD